MLMVQFFLYFFMKIAFSRMHFYFAIISLGRFEKHSLNYTLIAIVL